MQNEFEMKQRSLVNKGDISPEIAYLNTYYGSKEHGNKWVFNFFKKKRGRKIRDMRF